jgi:D-alanyl-D-alanine carboxypeptidase (penicillin-binding protein 5/6)
MSRSPHIRSREGRGRARRRRGPRPGALLLALLALATAVVGVGALVLALGLDPGPVTSGVRATPAVASVEAEPARSPLGLVLGTPPLRLTLADTRDPVHTTFWHEPREGLLFNLDSGRVLWRHDPLQRVPIASLTKMMTALLVVEHVRPDAEVLITPQALAFQGSGVGLLPRGKRVPLEALMYGLMLPSGNDAAIALAQHIAGTVQRFVRLMNVRAAQLGLGCTRFSSPHGFADADNYSCAADLAVLSHADLAQPRIARIARTATVVVPFPIKGGKLYLFNNNRLVYMHWPGITGLKTGFTDAAGRCLVATAKRHGVRLGVVLLNSPDPPMQARILLDRGFEGVYHQAPVPEPVIPPEVPLAPPAKPVFAQRH